MSTLLDMIPDSKRHVAQADFQRESIALMLNKHSMESSFVTVVSFDEVHLFCQEEQFLDFNARVGYILVMSYDDTEELAQ